MPIKYDIKNNTFFTSSEKYFLKGGNTDNNWVGHSLMKPVGSRSFQKIKTSDNDVTRKMKKLISGIKFQKEDSRWKTTTEKFMR